ncbi:hypothetical protein [Halorhodospira neutriphila]|uniref:Uncharacterized protein n=1 Tax=Halorhodospira neutriphila TaxID=168379 RepID=A0ABS1E1T3_9GAMM|nr:hypothetical protein [Halorhodospira neutriphila]MBK1725745.1 hypothetical protein [Halorhodospira neutriphila]
MEQQAAAPVEGPLDKAYRLLVNEEDVRVCREISPEACRVVVPVTGVIPLLSAMGLAGAWLSARLPER